jgi:hypothetical protein
MAKFEKGHTKATGRPKGAINKSTATIREKVQQLLDQYSIDKMVKDINSLEPKERLQILSGLLEFSIPKLARSEVKTEVTISETQIFEIGGQKIKFGD